MADQISAKTVRELREVTGSGMMDCKKALVECGGDVEKAREWLRKKGLQKAEKKGARATAQGIVGVYQHHDHKKAVLIEVQCETDFVARNEKFQEFAGNLAKHVMAMAPEYVSRDEVPADVVKKEEELVAAESAADLAKKPEAARQKIVEGRMRKFYEQRCLLDQKFVLDEAKTIESVVKEMIGSLGENIKVGRFARIEVGG